MCHLSLERQEFNSELFVAFVTLLARGPCSLVVWLHVEGQLLPLNPCLVNWITDTSKVLIKLLYTPQVRVLDLLRRLPKEIRMRVLKELLQLRLTSRPLLEG